MTTAPRTGKYLYEIQQVQLRVERMARDAVLDHVYIDSPVQQLLQDFLTRAAEIDSQDEPYFRTGGVKFKDVLLDPEDRLKSDKGGNKDDT